MDKLPIVNGKPWISRNVYIDIDTGEIITSKEAKKRDIKTLIKKQSYGEQHFNISEREYHCSTKQLRLF